MPPVEIEGGWREHGRNTHIDGLGESNLGIEDTSVCDLGMRKKGEHITTKVRRAHSQNLPIAAGT